MPSLSFHRLEAIANGVATVFAQRALLTAPKQRCTVTIKLVTGCDSFPRNCHRAGDEGRSGKERQLLVRCWVQSPTLSVKEEMRLPQGSDWSSIPEAGRNAG